MLHLQQNTMGWQGYKAQLLQTELFSSLDDETLEQAMHTMQARLYQYGGKTVVFHAGDPVDRLGVLLQGNIAVSRQDIMGNVFIVTHLQAPALFGEVLAFAGLAASPVTVTTIDPTTMIWLNIRPLLDHSDQEWPAKSGLIIRTLQILARKNLMLNEKLDIMSRRSIRAKIAAVLLQSSADQQSQVIHLPYNRQQLADYLAVDRSALSRELSKMKAEKLISFQKQSFQILDATSLTETI